MTGDEPRSLLEWFLVRTRRDGSRIAVWIPEANHFRRITWAEWGADVWHVAAALWQWGVRPGDRVAQLSENRYEWLVADLALQCVGAIQVPLHAGLTAPQVARAIEHSGSRFLLASTSDQVRKLTTTQLGAGLNSPAASAPLRVWTFDRILPGDLPPASDTFVESWIDRLDQADPAVGIRLAEEAVASARADSVLKILYTSGTTGEPKGVLLTVGNLLFNAAAVAVAYGARPDERKLNFLPLSHVFALTNDLYSTLVAGGELALARARDTVLDDAQQVQPTLMNGVPYFYARLRRVVGERLAAGQDADIRRILGVRIEICNAGGAALDESLHDFFTAQQVRMLQGYGLTETSPVICVSTPAADRRGAVGRPVPGVEVQIAPDGEVLTRGPHVMLGYHRDPDATRAALRDGWFHTGDLGQLDDDGFLRITGRKKDLLVLTTGKKVSPTAIESLLMADPLIQQALVVGDGRNYLAALLVLDWRIVARELRGTCTSAGPLREEHSTNAEPATDASDPLVAAIVGEHVRWALRDAAPWEQVRRFTLLDRPFSAEHGELTAKQSLRRDVIAARHADRIAALYAREK